jgi:hypothetical protein
MWSNVIGVESEQKGTNSAIEATLQAPSFGGGFKAQRQAHAQALVDQGGAVYWRDAYSRLAECHGVPPHWSLTHTARFAAFLPAAGYQAKATDLAGLLALAKAQGATGNANRGACRICGGLGHLTKKCTNGVSGHSGDITDLDAAAAGEVPHSADTYT